MRLSNESNEFIEDVFLSCIEIFIVVMMVCLLGFPNTTSNVPNCSRRYLIMYINVSVTSSNLSSFYIVESEFE